MTGKRVMLSVISLICLLFGACSLGTDIDTLRAKVKEEAGVAGDSGWNFNASNWSSWTDSASGVTISLSVASDHTCTITVGGNAVDGTPIWEYIWDANACYKYNPQAGKRYEYTFEAWTDGPERKLNINYYGDDSDGVWVGLETGFDGDSSTKFKINSTPTTYTIIGDVIPKSGEQDFRFGCGNQTGTFFVKMIEIREYVVNGVSITGTPTVGQTLTANTANLGGTGTISYQWKRGDTSSAAGTNISGATSSTYTLVAADLNKYIIVTVTRGGTSVTSASVGPVQQQQSSDILGEYPGSTPTTEGLTSSVPTYQIVNIPSENNRTYVMKVSPTSTDTNSEYAVAKYSLASYKGQTITFHFSADVKRVGNAGKLMWQILDGAQNYPIVTFIENPVIGNWYSMTGTWSGTLPDNDNTVLYLTTNWNNGTDTTYYIDNFTITITTVGNPDNQTPVEGDYDISGTGTYTYDGSVKTVGVTAKSGKSPGAITVKYNNSTTAPSAVGTYTVTFDVVAATGWNAVSGLSAGTLTIVSASGSTIITLERSTGADYDVWQYLYELPLNGSKIIAGETYTFTYSFTSNYAISNLWIDLVDNSDGAANNWQRLSPYMDIHNISANTTTAGTLDFTATGTASSTDADANKMQIGINYSSLQNQPTLTFTQFTFTKKTTSGGNTISPPTTGVTAFTANTWADGSLSANGEQWFSFTATASTQYIHASFGTLTDLYVQVYDSSGATVGSQTELYSSGTKYVSRSVTSNQTYYIKVTPYSSSNSGAYKIGFNTSAIPPGAIALTANTWADGSLLENGEQWFSFTATAATQYIHASFGTLTDLYVQVYNSSGAAVGDRANLYGSGKYVSRSVTSSQTYYIKVTPYSSNSGTYKIAFNTSAIPPGAIALTANTWADGSLPENGEQWFSFTATAATQYIHASFINLNSDAGFYLRLYNSSGDTVGDQTRLYGSTTSVSLTVTTNQTYYIKVTPYSSSNSDTYKITFNASPIPPGAIALTANTWADGNFTANKVQWFTFTATAATQYIHASFGTLSSSNGLYVQLYDSSGTAVGNQTYLHDTTVSISPIVTQGQTYCIKVTPYSSSNSGTYKIAFNTSLIPPGAIELTENDWKDGDLTANKVQWFSFTATASTQRIRASFGTLNSSGGLSVQVYTSSDVAVDTQATLNSENGSFSRSVTQGSTYYIKVTPYSSSYSGTYKIVFYTDIIPVTSTVLTANTWADGTLAANGEQWFKFTATATTHYIHTSFGTLTNLYVIVTELNGTSVGDRTNLTNTSSNKYISRAVTPGQTYYIKVTPTSSSNSGTYKIAFNTGGIPPGATPTALTLSTWASGNLPQYGEQWFTFTATTSTQYIHVSFATLTGLYVQVYDSGGTAVGSQTSLSGSSRSISRPVTSGSTYYIKIIPSSSSYSGTYQIAFNESSAAPL